MDDCAQCITSGHRFDPDTPIAETMQALHDVVQAGYARYIGMSSCYAYQCALVAPVYIPRSSSSPTLTFLTVHQMQHYAITHNLTPFISMQNHYSLLYREEEREMLPTLKVCT
jgi:aryl-alcohol dehydrogenase-like predicted oxidoreductase